LLGIGLLVASVGCGGGTRARESLAIGEIRTVLGAQHAYRNELGAGYYDKLECLVDPGDCILGYAEDAPRFLHEASIVPSRYDHEYTFHPGRAAPPEVTRLPGLSPSLIDRWAYVAVPRPSYRGRAFCGDSRGLICVFREGDRPRIEGGLCAVSPESMPTDRVASQDEAGVEPTWCRILGE
jgi:hypothetical protein